MSNTQEETYIHSLRQIKEKEDRAQKEIEAYKKMIAEQIRNLQIEAEGAIESAKVQGENLVEKSIEQAKQYARNDADKIIEDAMTKSKTISRQITRELISQIIDILLKGVY